MRHKLLILSAILAFFAAPGRQMLHAAEVEPAIPPPQQGTPPADAEIDEPNEPEATEAICKTCFGAGHIDCPECRSAGAIWCSKCPHRKPACPRCLNSGHIPCPECAKAAMLENSTGNSHKSHYDLSALPPSIVANFIIVEDDALRLVTDLEHKEAHDFFRHARNARAVFRRKFGIEDDEKLWQGRCSIHVFKDRQTYALFVTYIDGLPEMSHTTAYSHPTQASPVVVIARGDNSTDATYRAAIHELSHVFLELYHNDTRMPSWLTEGVAQWFEFRCKPEGSRRPACAELSRTAVRFKAARLKDVMQTGLVPTNEAGYALAWSLTEFLVEYKPNGSGSGKGFQPFVKMLKEGVDQETALRKAYNAPLDKLQKRWYSFVRKTTR